MILVTGHKGFIGSHVYTSLKFMGYPVIGVDKKDGKSIIEWDGYNKDIAVVVHCAANLYEDFQENINSTEHLVTKLPDARFIFLSSAAVYGDNYDAVETDPLDPWGEYGESKAFEESLIQQTEKYTIFRLGNVYGYGTDHGVVANFINGSKKVYNSGLSIRDFVHVDDVTNMIITTVLYGNISGIYNLATGVGTSIIDVFKRIYPSDKPEMAGPKKEINTSILNINKLKEIGYNPRVINE